VKRPAVELDYESLGSPKAVDLDPSPRDAQGSIDLRPRHAATSEQCQEPFLEFTAGNRGANVTMLEDVPDDSDASTSRIAGKQGRKREGISQPAYFSLVDRPFDSVARQHSGQVEEGPGHGRHGDPASFGDLVGWQIRVVGLDTGFQSASLRDRYLDQRSRRRPQVPEGGRGAMTQNRAVSTRKHGGHPASLTGKGAVSDGVHRAVQSLQPTGDETVFHCPRANAQIEQLSPSDDAVLPLRQRRDRSVNPRDATFSPYNGVK
jgi:hypothetical protein